MFKNKVKFRVVRSLFANLIHDFKQKIPIKVWNFQTIRKNISLANAKKLESADFLHLLYPKPFRLVWKVEALKVGILASNSLKGL